MKSVAAIALPAILFAAQPAQAEDDWSDITLRDLEFIDAHLAETHPGVVDPENPDFRRKMADALDAAQSAARLVESEAGYFWTIRRYLAAFGDLHVGIAGFREPDVVQWPGFTIDAQFRVMSSSEPGSPPLGAEMIECDGKAAEYLAAERVGGAVGLWQLRAQRLRWTSRLLAFNDPGLQPFASCRFRIDGEERDYPMQWREGRLSELIKRMPSGINQRGGPIRRNASFERIGDNTLWLQLPTFGDNPGSPENRALEDTLASLKESLGSRPAPLSIVLDMRGNGGGSDLWAYRISEMIWGRQQTDAKAEYPEYALRPSLATIEELENSLADYGQDMSGDELEELKQQVFALRAAREAGQGLVRFSSRPVSGPGEETVRSSPPVYVLTDPTCFSACLSAMDLWLALGAIHVGQETAADTRYLEVRFAPLPSGRGRLFSPTAILYRRRGDNVTFVPAQVFPGDMTDDMAVRKWVLDLVTISSRSLRN